MEISAFRFGSGICTKWILYSDCMAAPRYRIDLRCNSSAVVCGCVFNRVYSVFCGGTAKNPVVAIVGNSLLFALLHLANHGVTILSVLNIFLVGILFSLMVYYMDSLWCAFAVHTAWNFTQNILFGLPNSGINVPYSVFKLNAATARDSFAYNVGFGIEGTVFADIVLLAACVLLYLWGRKHGKKSMDVWAET